MGFLRRRKRPPPGEWPESFTRAWTRRTLPSATPAEAKADLELMRRKGWPEAERAERMLRDRLPPDEPADPDPRQEEISLPPRVSRAWLDEQLPSLDRRQIRLVVEELERRGWPSGEVALATLPHLLPKLPQDEAAAILADLEQLGMAEEDVERLRRNRPA